MMGRITKGPDVPKMYVKKEKGVGEAINVWKNATRAHSGVSMGSNPV